MKTQNQLILKHLRDGNSITQKEAARAPFYCMRLAARISDLRAGGYNVQTTVVKRRSPRTGRAVAYARYTMGVS